MTKPTSRLIAVGLMVTFALVTVAGMADAGSFSAAVTGGQAVTTASFATVTPAVGTLF
jgi:hypothetical protein